VTSPFLSGLGQTIDQEISRIRGEISNLDSLVEQALRFKHELVNRFASSWQMTEADIRHLKNDSNNYIPTEMRMRLAQINMDLLDELLSKMAEYANAFKKRNQLQAQLDELIRRKEEREQIEQEQKQLEAEQRKTEAEQAFQSMTLEELKARRDKLQVALQIQRNFRDHQALPFFQGAGIPHNYILFAKQEEPFNLNMIAAPMYHANPALYTQLQQSIGIIWNITAEIAKVDKRIAELTTVVSEAPETPPPTPPTEPPPPEKDPVLEELQQKKEQIDSQIAEAKEKKEALADTLEEAGAPPDVVEQIRKPDTMTIPENVIGMLQQNFPPAMWAEGVRAVQELQNLAKQRQQVDVQITTRAQQTLDVTSRPGNGAPPPPPPEDEEKKRDEGLPGWAWLALGAVALGGGLYILRGRKTA
jgi:hypothetical protein